MDIARLDFNLLVTLEALLDERSVSRAARRLGLSQPALSAQLARLRAMFGDQLFVPSHRGMTPTPLALQLAAPLAEALARLRDVVTSARAFDPARDTFTVRIAASDYVQQALVLDFILALRRSAPGVRVALRTIDPARLAAQMEQGEVDLAALTLENIADGLRSRALFEERYLLVARTGHPALRRPLTVARYAELDHVIFSARGGGFVTPVDDLLDGMGLARRIAVSASTFLAAIDLVERSDMVALVPSRLLGRTGRRLRVLEPPLPVPGFAIRMAWHDRTHRDAVQRWVRAQMLAFAASAARSSFDPDRDSKR